MSKTTKTEAVTGEVITPAPTTNRSELVEQVIELMGEGWSERKACEKVGIARSTFRTTALRHQSGVQYAHALENLAHHQIELVEQTIEDMRKGKVDAMMAKVEIDARKWFASKFLPKQYGDKIDHTTNGRDLPSPILGLLTPSDDVHSDNGNQKDS